MIPMGAVAAGLVDFAIASAMLTGHDGLVRGRAGLDAAAAPALVLGLVIAALGVGVLLSALTVAYRDFRHVVPFLVQFWMFATPCIYLQQEDAVGPRSQLLLPLNPAYGLIANFRSAMLGLALRSSTRWPSPRRRHGVLLLLGCFYFRRVGKPLRRHHLRLRRG